MRPPLASILAVLALVATAPGCITVHTLGPRTQPMVETVVHGESGPKVLLLDVDNVITDVEVRGPFGITASESTVSRIREQLEKAEKDEAMAAILLRINSPGGGVTASDVIYREILRFKEENEWPVVAQMMGMAASGGYYVAMAADHVIAHPTTVTGSIGVISAGINVSGLMERYGVADQTFTAGAFKDAGSPLRPMTPEERAYIQDILDDLHGRFRAVVLEGRPGLDADRVAALADGRIYTAGQALEHGLVDAIGYLPDAIHRVEESLEVDEVRVVAYHREREWRPNVYSSAPAAPRADADVAERLGLDRGPRFLYLWWPGGLAY